MFVQAVFAGFNTMDILIDHLSFSDLPDHIFANAYKLFVDQYQQVVDNQGIHSKELEYLQWLLYKHIAESLDLSAATTFLNNLFSNNLTTDYQIKELSSFINAQIRLL
jgi:hypothetical protein